MGKWFNQSQEITKLRLQIQEQARVINKLTEQLRMAGIEIDDPKAVSAEERRIAQSGKAIEAIKMYRERTGAGLKEAKDAIDTVL